MYRGYSLLFALSLIGILVTAGCDKNPSQTPDPEPESAQPPMEESEISTLSDSDLPDIADNAPRRFPVEIDDKWGYIDREGELVIEPQYDDADDFHNGLGAIKIDDQTGYIDEDGEIVIAPQFREGGPFAEELAAVCPDDDDALGFIDRNGQWIIPAEFECMFESTKRTWFSDGLAPVKVPDPLADDNAGFIDRSGQWVIEPQFRNARSFSEGLAAVQQPDRSYVFIDDQGDVILDGKWSDARSFANGLAPVDTEASGRAWHYIDTTGEIAVEPVFGEQRDSSPPSNAYPFSEGLAAVSYDPTRWEYILPEPQGSQARFTLVENSLYYAKASPFRGGLARVVAVYRQNDTSGPTIYINRQGEQIWPNDE